MLRTLTNAGDPLMLGNGEPIANTVVQFDLVDSRRKKMVSLFDVISGEYIGTGTVSATTDLNGIFTIDLWPNLRGEVATLWKVTVGDLETAPFYISIADGIPALSLLEAKAAVAAVTQQEETLIASMINAAAEALIIVGEAANQSEEDALFAAGYKFVIRTDLMTTTTTAAPTTTTAAPTTTTAAPTTTTAAPTTTTAAPTTTTTTAAPTQEAPTATIGTYPITAVPTGVVQQYGAANPTLVDIPLY